MKIRLFLTVVAMTFGVFLTTNQLSAHLEAKFIGEDYATGVVKIILYDDQLVEAFQLSDDEGQLSRASGFFVTPEGVIFTNRHVVEWCVYGYVLADWVDENGDEHDLDILTYTPGLENKKKIKKIYYVGHAKPYIQVFREKDDRKYDIYVAKVLTLNESFDGAILQLETDLEGNPIDRKFKFLPLGDSDKVALGEDLLVMGYPSEYVESDMDLDLRDTLTMTFGKNSGWDYVFDEDNGLIKTVASIHEGNSGGPVFGEENTVIGLATALGLQTKIGLVGGINSMYWVAKPLPKIFDQLVKNGLTKPSNESAEGKTIAGDPRPLPHIPTTRPQIKVKKKPLSDT